MRGWTLADVRQTPHAGAELPEGAIEFIVAADSGIRAGYLGTATNDLSRLIGHATTPLKETLAQHLPA